MQRRSLTVVSTVLLSVFLLGLPVACSEASARDCCTEGAELIEQMDDCCVQNLGKPVDSMTGCCAEGMKPDATDRPDCCTKALDLQSQMAECCRVGMKNAVDACCLNGVPKS